MEAAWPTVRVFISSTFRDMHAERDHLVRVVFPELAERMAARRVHLRPVDLRWGVLAEEDSLEVCLDVIEECRPFFVGLLGERYGTVVAPALSNLGRTDEAIAAQRRAVETGVGWPQEDWWCYNAGFTLFNHGRYAEALELFERVLEIAPPDSEARPAAMSARAFCRSNLGMGY